MKTRLSEGTAGRVIETGKPIFTGILESQSSVTRSIAQLMGFEVHSMLTVPLKTTIKLGALQVLNKNLVVGCDRRFTDEDLALLAEVAEYTAVLLHWMVDPRFVPSAEDRARYVAKLTELPLVTKPEEIEIDEKLIEVVGPAIIRREGILPHKFLSPNSVAVLMTNPLDYARRESFTQATEYSIEEVSVVSAPLFDTLAKRFKDSLGACEAIGAIEPAYTGAVVSDLICSAYSGVGESNLNADEVPKPVSYEDVQFTVFRPHVMSPRKWHPFLAFAHSSERRPDAARDELDPLKEVHRQASAVLGALARNYRNASQDSFVAVPAAGELTFLPEVAGLEFNPPRATFLFLESVHRQDFRVRSAAGFDAGIARGRLSVFLGTRLLADVPITIRVSHEATANALPAAEAVSARPYRKVFASYSHRDAAVVDHFERFAASFGDCYLRDSISLRAGEAWSERLAEMINEADVFQLFWSSHSMRSKYVRQEWEHALSLGRPHFVRPVYWEDPRPKDEANGLPTPELSRLHFQRLIASDVPPGQSEPAGVPDTPRKEDNLPVAIPAPDVEAVLQPPKLKIDSREFELKGTALAGEAQSGQVLRLNPAPEGVVGSLP